MWQLEIRISRQAEAACLEPPAPLVFRATGLDTSHSVNYATQERASLGSVSCVGVSAPTECHANARQLCPTFDHASQQGTVNSALSHELETLFSQ